MQDDVKSNEIEQKNGVDSTSKTSSRRKFIKKAAVGGIITTLPATSVWGVCRVSGALSGGSQHTDVCSIPTLNKGRPPEFFAGPQESPSNKYYPGFSSYEAGDEVCIKAAIDTKLLETIIISDDAGTPEGTLSLQLGTAIETNSPDDLNKAFATAYLHSLYGFDDLPPYGVFPGDTKTEIFNPEDLISYLYAAFLRDELSSSVQTAIENSYTYDESIISGSAVATC